MEELQALISRRGLQAHPSSVPQVGSGALQQCRAAQPLELLQRGPRLWDDLYHGSVRGACSWNPVRRRWQGQQLANTRVEGTRRLASSTAGDVWNPCRKVWRSVQVSLQG